MSLESSSQVQAFDWKTLLFSFQGRTRRSHFWIGWLIVQGLGFVLGFIPVVGILGLVLIWPNLAINVKRLHDMGKSGWLQLIPIVIFIVAIVVGVIAGGAAAVMGAMSGHSDAEAGMAALGGLGLFFIMLCLAGLVGLIFLLWVGVSPTQPGENRYGPEPGTGAATPPATV